VWTPTWPIFIIDCGHRHPKKLSPIQARDAVWHSATSLRKQLSKLRESDLRHGAVPMDGHCRQCAKTISGRAYRHTATHYAYSCSVDWCIWHDSLLWRKHQVEGFAESARLLTNTIALRMSIAVGGFSKEYYRRRMYPVLHSRSLHGMSRHWIRAMSKTISGRAYRHTAFSLRILLQCGLGQVSLEPTKTLFSHGLPFLQTLSSHVLTFLQDGGKGPS